jgi:SAM-dependent methyltransferase
VTSCGGAADTGTTVVDLVETPPQRASEGGEVAHSGDELSRIYRERFSDDELEDKRVLWAELCSSFFSRYVRPNDTVVDLAAGTCEFINAIDAAEKIAVDFNPDVKQYATNDTRIVIAPSTNMEEIGDESVDIVFTSNFFEHLPSKRALLDTLAECRRILRPGGRIIVVMPNIRYLAGRYWDYLDHHLPLTHLSVAEALEVSGFELSRVVPRFLPYTVKDSPLRVQAWMVRLYLKLPIVWRVLGRQMLVIGERG